MRWMNQNQSIGVKIRMKLTPRQQELLRKKDGEERQKMMKRWEDEYISAARQAHRLSKTNRAFSDWFRDWQKHNKVHRRPRKETFKNDISHLPRWNDD